MGGRTYHGRWVYGLIALGCTAQPGDPLSGPVKTGMTGASSASAAKAFPPECDKVRSCLDAELPERVRTSDWGSISDATMTCLGGSKRTAWDNRRCLPFEFGKEADTGQALQVSVACDDVCPDQMMVTFTMAGDIADFECSCLGRTPVYRGGWGGYVGCSPARSSSRVTFSVDQRGDEVIALDGRGMSMSHLGFHQGAAFDSIDGAPVRDPDDVARILERLPRHVPGSILMHHQGRLPGDTEDGRLTTDIRYIDDETAGELERLATRLQLTTLVPRAKSCFAMTGSAKITVGTWAITYDPECSDATMGKVAAMEKAIRDAAASARPRSPARQGRDCKKLDARARVFTLVRNRHTLDVRYVDWID